MMHEPMNIKFIEKSQNSLSAELFYVSDIYYQLKSTSVLFTTQAGNYYFFLHKILYLLVTSKVEGA
jgi:hypothetical protein